MSMIIVSFKSMIKISDDYSLIPSSYNNKKPGLKIAENKLAVVSVKEVANKPLYLTETV